MKKIAKHLHLLAIAILFAGSACLAQTTTVASTTENKMHMYVIERDITGLGQFTPEKLKSVSQASCAVLNQMGSKIQWDHSYVTEDKMFCVYRAENIELVKEHAQKGGFPANHIYEVTTVISPATAK